MYHIGRNTKSTIIAKGISAGKSQNSYRGLVQIHSRAENARNFSQCDSLLMGNDCGAHTFPYIEVKNKTAQIERLENGRWVFYSHNALVDKFKLSLNWLTRFFKD